MARPAKPDYVENVLFIVAIVMMRLDTAFLKAFGARRRSCQRSFFNRGRNGNTAAGKHSRVLNIAIAPSFFVVLMPLLYFFWVVFNVTPFNGAALVTVLFLPLSIIGCMGCCSFVRHPESITPPARRGILQLALGEV